MSFGGGDGSGVMSEINITPLCDIFVVLLIIFMLTADAITAKGPKIDLPMMADEVKNDAQVSVTLDKDKKLYVNMQEVDQKDFVRVLHEKLSNPKLANKHVVFRGDKGMLMRDVMTVMVQCNEAIGKAGDPNPQVSIGTGLETKK